MILRPENLDPFDRVVARLKNVKPRGNGVRATCPAHDDHTPSLDVDRDANGNVLLICRAGCSTESIVKAIGLDLRDLFVVGGAHVLPASRKAVQRYPDAEAVGQMFQSLLKGTMTTYRYRDATNDVVGAVFRFDHEGKPKDIRQARRDGTEWTAEGMIAPRALYRLPDLLAAHLEEPVLVFEGEKKTDKVVALGEFVATTSCGGSSAPSKTDWSPLAGRHVVIAPDHDEPGRSYRDAVANLARAAGAASVSVLELPGLGEGEDVADWIAARELDGRTHEQIAAELRDLVVLAPRLGGGGRTKEDDAPPATFPAHALPPALRTMVIEGAASQGVDVGYWSVPVLGILAGCIGATRRVRVTADWTQPCVVWSAVIAPSGAGKSPPLRALLSPVREHDYTLNLKTVAAQEQHAAELDAWKAFPAAERGPRPPPPPILAATIDDATMEAVAMRLVDNPRGLLLAVDELAGWLTSMDKYRKGGGDEQRWLSLHSATSFPIDRKGSTNAASRIYVRNPCVSIVGTIQPSVARRHLGNAERRASGACARVLLAAPPVTAARLTDRGIPKDVRDAYGRLIRSLLDLRLGDAGEPVDVPLSPAALSRFRPWHDRNGMACADAGLEGDEDTAAMLSKLRGYAPCIALVLALARAAEDGMAAVLNVVDDDAMRAAIEIVDYFGSEARRIYGRWSADDAAEHADRERGSLPTLADRLAEILRSGPKDREDLRNATGRNIRAPRMDAALAILKADGRATMQLAVGPRGGRPREVWILKPRGTA